MNRPQTAVCVHCGKSFKHRPGKQYCSDLCRAKAWRTPTEAKPCIYCGVPSEGIDHIPPQSVRPAIIDMGLREAYVFLEVPACKECNCLLGARSLWLLKDRKRFIKKALAMRYAKYLRIPNWTDKELALFHERSYLHRHIRQGLIIRDLVKERIAYG